MSILKQKIKFIPNTVQNIQFIFEGDVNLLGLQQDIDDFVVEETGLSINDVEDGERFRYKPNIEFGMDVYFYSGTTYSTSYEYADFTSGETNQRKEVISRSFYLMQVYDSVNIENQTLLHTGYYNGYNFINENETNSTYLFNPIDEKEFTNIYIPQWFIGSMTADTITLYGKISFFNAKTGELQLFSQSNSASYVQPVVDSNLYFNITLSASTFQYTPPSTIYSYEIKNDNYIEKINKTITPFSNLKPTYPTGNTFLNTAKYVSN